MIKARVAQLFKGILFFFCLADVVCGQTRSSGSISGHVFYEDGSPVVGAEVELHSFQAVEGILPSPAYTDKNGAYRIDNPVVGQGVLSASKVSEGFPDAALRIYGKFGETGYPSLKELTITPGSVLRDEALRFSAPDAILELRVVDGKSSQPIAAQVAIGLLEDPNPMITETIAEGTTFTFVIPKHPITVRVSAPGYNDWSYLNSTTRRKSLSAPLGTRVELTATLTPK
jgi:hypothetical protein